MAQIATSRQDTAIRQAKSREKMLASSIQKQPPVKVGDCVLIPASEFYTGRLDCRNIPGVVSQVTSHGLYKIATEHLIRSCLEINLPKLIVSC
jgi:hypothetical protein